MTNQSATVNAPVGFSYLHIDDELLSGDDSMQKSLTMFANS